MDSHAIVSKEEWLEARKRLLAEEKAFTRARDQLSRRRRELPWTLVDKTYRFETPAGERTLAELFDKRSQLIVYHFMFAPDWEAGCKSCSFWADNFNGITVHLNHRDVTMIAVSRAPLAKLAAYKARMGWRFPWVSSFGSDFNRDFGVSFTQEEISSAAPLYNYATKAPPVSELVGISVFAKDASGAIFHTYSTYGRGVDMLNGAYHYLDLVPKGRDEMGTGNPQAWVRRHDEYDR
jgi:predicted dithiol-disulfide oxidoreductase (DUF899 family)